MEIAIAAGLAITIALLLAVILRMPRSTQNAGDAAGIMSRLTAIETSLVRTEGGLQAINSSQETRIQGLAQATNAGLETIRSSIDQKLGQTLVESRDGRNDLAMSFQAFETKLEQKLASVAAAAEASARQLQQTLATTLEAAAVASGQAFEKQRNDVNGQLATMSTAIREQLEGNGSQLRNQLSMIQESVAQKLAAMSQESLQTSEQLRSAVNDRLKAIQDDSATKLEEMRKTVEEKLHSTLNERLGQSFQMVSERLEQVHRGLGEMQTLASGVGDLKRMLTNVKTRGTWGEFQLESLITEMLTPDQFARNVVTRPGMTERVEFAIRLPGNDPDQPVWLPVDAKFPMEDYQRLVDAQDLADIEQVEAAGKALEARVRQEAKTIREKYVETPYTTDFAILYLPTEGLYAEVLRRPGLADSIQRDHRVLIAGPTNLNALLNSLQMGFRTLAIEKRSSEVWTVLGTVKTEFSKFGVVIAATQKKLEEATNKFNEVGVRTRAIERKLRDVEVLPMANEITQLAVDLQDAEDDQ